MFTLGSNSVMQIDEIVYDPGRGNTALLTTCIKIGAFRFVSRQVARFNSDAMAVKLPAATTGMRGTFVGGEVEENRRDSVILLGPAPNNALGLPPGAISVADDFELLGNLNITSYGVDAYRKLADTVQASANINYVERAYKGTKSSKEGNTTGVSIGFNYLVNPSVTLGASSNYQISNPTPTPTPIKSRKLPPDRLA